ncbi:hypothetical protein AIOL_000248 [Candidatus Rhodobacter oscarellae]|uniref:Glycosyltransferase n=1 Tax=Candidatus Rhodobacter oscarellae TaxID=1675527 RepID=A0A0J9EBS8_9RHOB|nr:hypothetical protein [Candidatus Rhodobacter lobularis]KMW60096.1 hypothetical protein AIOL_000248 [Candidatus Rhodobacter lobularis]
MIIALTSIPPRFGGLGARLRAILAQAPERVVVTIPNEYARFPEWGGALPDLPVGVELFRGPDHGPATKCVEVFQCFPRNDVLICDDDCDYGPGWLEAFRLARAAHPNAVIAASTFGTERLGLAQGDAVVQGFAGVLLRPEWLDISPPDAQAQWVDDIWLSAVIAAAGLEVVPVAQARACVTPLAQAAALQSAQIQGQSRADLNRSVALRLASSYGVWGK